MASPRWLMIIYRCYLKAKFLFAYFQLKSLELIEPKTTKQSILTESKSTNYITLNILHLIMPDRTFKKSTRAQLHPIENYALSAESWKRPRFFFNGAVKSSTPFELSDTRLVLDRCYA